MAVARGLRVIAQGLGKTPMQARCAYANYTQFPP